MKFFQYYFRWEFFGMHVVGNWLTGHRQYGCVDDFGNQTDMNIMQLSVSLKD